MHLVGFLLTLNYDARNHELKKNVTYIRQLTCYQENTEALLVASMESGLEVNVDKTKCMVRFRDQNAGRSQNIKTDNSSFERVDQFEYMGMTLKNHNSIQEEIKSRMKSGNACYHSVQNLLPYILLSQNIKNYSFVCFVWV